MCLMTAVIADCLSLQVFTDSRENVRKYLLYLSPFNRNTFLFLPHLPSPIHPTPQGLSCFADEPSCIPESSHDGLLSSCQSCLVRHIARLQRKSGKGQEEVASRGSSWLSLLHSIFFPQLYRLFILPCRSCDGDIHRGNGDVLHNLGIGGVFLQGWICLGETLHLADKADNAVGFGAV